VSSRTDDTLSILADSGGRTATVKRISYTDNEKRQLPVPLSATEDALAVVDSGLTVQVQPRRETYAMTRDERGTVTEYSDTMYFPLTSTVAVGDRVFLDGEEDYYEVKTVDVYEDHKRLRTQRVVGR
jgi:hypothetical protein